MKQSILKLLASDGFITVNVHIIKAIGLHEAVILGQLASAQNYHKGDWFYQTYEQIQDRTGIGKKPASIAIKNLMSLGILYDKKIGIPCRRYFKINETAIISVLEKHVEKPIDDDNGNDKEDPNGTTGETQKERQAVANGYCNNNTEKENKKKNISCTAGTNVPKENELSEQQKTLLKTLLDAYWDTMKMNGRLPTLKADLNKLFFSCKAYAEAAVQRWSDEHLRGLWNFAITDDFWKVNINHLKQLDKVNIRYEEYLKELKHNGYK